MTAQEVEALKKYYHGRIKLIDHVTGFMKENRGSAKSIYVGTIALCLLAKEGK